MGLVHRRLAPGSPEIEHNPHRDRDLPTSLANSTLPVPAAVARPAYPGDLSRKTSLDPVEESGPSPDSPHSINGLRRRLWRYILASQETSEFF